MAERVRQCRQYDEEREERDQRQISKVTGVDESVRIDADGDPLDDVEQARMPPVNIGMIPTPLGRFG
jgi:hypothetical protein